MTQPDTRPVTCATCKRSVFASDVDAEGNCCFCVKSKETKK